MKNTKTVPRAFGDALSLADKSAGGLNKLGAVIRVSHTTEALMHTIMAAAVAANDEYQTVKAARRAAAQAQAIADDRAYRLILTARDVLKPVLGSRYSQAWNQAGFVAPTLAVPSTIAKRVTCMKLLQTYFAAHPEHAVPNLAVTAANAGAVHDELTASIDAFAVAKVVQRQKKAAYRAAFAALRAELQKLHGELKVALAKNDPRWLEFGFRIPARVHVTAAAEGDVASGG